MDFNEYEPEEGWKRFCEERGAKKMGIGDMAAVIMLMVIILGAYVAVGNLEMM